MDIFCTSFWLREYQTLGLPFQTFEEYTLLRTRLFHELWNEDSLHGLHSMKNNNPFSCYKENSNYCHLDVLAI
jgi:hypothetical protein